MSKVGAEYLLSDEKRALDVLGSVVLAGGMSPVLGASAVASAVDSRSAWPLFRQDRVGRGLGVINVLKLCTIRPDRVEDDELQTYGTFDPRASRAGLFMRQTGIDELPQLLNVLMGDMSLVGHRPLVQEDIERRQSTDSKLFEDWHEVYDSFKPGLIGKSQILRHHYLHTSPEILIRSMELDVRYAETATLGLDIKTILSSPFKMFAANIRPVDNAV